MPMTHTQRLISALVLIIVSTKVDARNYTTPVLTDAHQLLATQPYQAIELINQYLMSQPLTQSLNTSRLQINKEDENHIRTPLKTIKALQIKATALSKINQSDAALITIHEARVLAQEHALHYIEIETYLLEANLQWHIIQDEKQAIEILNSIETKIIEFEQIGLNNKWQKLRYQTHMQQAEIYAVLDDQPNAEKHFQKAKNHLQEINNPKYWIQYQLALGNYYLMVQHHRLALDTVLKGYLLALEQKDSANIAKADMVLARLFQQRNVYDKALEHATHAADYHERHNQPQLLSRAIGLMALIYEHQNRHNLALIHYFNALDLERQFKIIQRPSEELRLNIARVYLALFNYPKAKHYLDQARYLAQQAQNENILSQILLLEGQWMLAQGKNKQAIELTKQALLEIERLELINLQLIAEETLSTAFEKKGDYYNALASQRRYEKLFKETQTTMVKNNAELFKQQQRVYERALHLDKMEETQFTHEKSVYLYQWILIILAIITFSFIGWSHYHRRQIKTLQKRLCQLKSDFYTHPRSGLKNLRMLNERLPTSLQQSSAYFEQCVLGEIIHEPLSDRLRFALFEIPLLKHWYQQEGYQQALELEQKFGQYLNEQICEPARLYHFSDALFLYVEPNSRLHTEPQQLAQSIEKLVMNFMQQHNLQTKIKIGMAEYPFLPRAYTAINARELLDILLMATQDARLNADENHALSWTHYQAIEAAPAAFFANGNIRHACQQGIEKGLIRIQRSKDQLTPETKEAAIIEDFETH